MNYDNLKKQWLQRKAKVKAMRASGLTAIQIALKLKITRQRVYQMLK